MTVASSRLPLALALLVLAACQLQLPTSASVAYACEDDSDCRAGTFCQNNLCLSIDGGSIHRDSGLADRTGVDLAGTDAALPDRAGVDQVGSDRTSADAGPWWDAAWHRRRKLSFDNRGRTSALDDFPVLIELRPDRIDYGQVTGDGNDLRFVDENGTTLLDYQLERWNTASTSWLWVRVPRIDADTASDFIWMYYGNPGAPMQGNGVAVWDTSYQAVYPLSYNFQDMSGHGVDGTDRGSADVAGQIARGRRFDGSAWIDLGSGLPLLMSAPAVTLSAWIAPAALTDDQAVVAIAKGGATPTGQARAFLALRSGNVAVGGRSQDSEAQQELVSTSQPLTLGPWHHVVGIINYTSARAQIFVDGLAVAEGPLAITANAVSPTQAASAAIGASADGLTTFFDGDIDDVRISNASRSADWISAEHQNQGLDSFVLYGLEESR